MAKKSIENNRKVHWKLLQNVFHHLEKYRISGRQPCGIWKCVQFWSSCEEDIRSGAKHKWLGKQHILWISWKNIGITRTSKIVNVRVGHGQPELQKSWKPWQTAVADWVQILTEKMQQSFQSNITFPLSKITPIPIFLWFERKWKSYISL